MVAQLKEKPPAEKVANGNTKTDKSIHRSPTDRRQALGRCQMRPTNSEAKKARGPKRNAPRGALPLSLNVKAPKNITRNTANPMVSAIQKRVQRRGHRLPARAVRATELPPIIWAAAWGGYSIVRHLSRPFTKPPTLGHNFKATPILDQIMEYIRSSIR